MSRRTSNTQSQKLLEERYLKDANGKNELVKRLKEVHAVLKEAKQDEDASHFDGVAQAVVSQSICNHKDKDVRLLAACCLVDILNVYAPEPPYSPEELKRLFGLVITQLHGLSNRRDPMFPRYFYLLENLARVQSANLLVDLEANGVRGGTELLVDLFDCFFTSVHSDLSSQLIGYMADVMESCIEECDNITQPLLDVILTPLLPTGGSEKLEDRSAYELAKKVIGKSINHLQPIISQFLNSLLVGGTSAEAARGEQSELSDHADKLIYELHKVNPQLLLYVLPNVCLQLQVDEQDVRVRAVALLGRLFVSPHAEYAEQYAKNFRDYMRRFTDTSVEIRKQMLQIGCLLLLRKPAQASIVQEALERRLLDSDWSVRLKAVEDILQLGLMENGSLSALSKQLLRAVGERVKDKKIAIRKAAMTGLARLYHKHVSSLWALDCGEGDEDVIELEPSADALSKLEWVPEQVLLCYSFPEDEIKVRVIQLLDGVLLPSKASETGRAKVLLELFSRLPDDGVRALRRLLLDRRRAQSALAAYIKLRLQRVTDGDDDNDTAARGHAERCTHALMMLLPYAAGVENGKEMLERLHRWEDLHVFRGLATLSNPRSSAQQLNTAKEDVLSRLGSKSPLGAFMRVLLRRAAHAGVTIDVVEAVLLTAVEAAKEGEVEDATLALQLVEICSSLFPSQLASCVRPLADLLGIKANDEILLLGLRILSHVVKAAETQRQLMEEAGKDQADTDAGAGRKGAVTKKGKAKGKKGKGKKRGKVESEDDEEDEDEDEEKVEVTGSWSVPQAVARLLKPRLVKLAKEGDQKQAKFSMRCLLGLFPLPATPNGPAAVNNWALGLLRNHLLDDETLQVGQPHLPATLSSLCELLTHAPQCVTETEVTELANFVRDEVVLAPATSTSGKASHKKGGNNYASTLAVTARVVGLKLLTAIAVAERGEAVDRDLAEARAVNRGVASGKRGQPQMVSLSQGSQQSVAEGGDSQAKSVLVLLFEFLESNGDVPTPNGSSSGRSASAARVRSVVFSCVLRLESSPQRGLVTVLQWHALARVLQDPDVTVRRAVVSKLARRAAAGLLNQHKYLAMLPLCATDSENTIKKEARATLHSAITMLRKSHQTHGSFSNSSGGSSGAGSEGGGESREVSVAGLMPEYILPYTLHLLAHHPDFPLGAGDTPRMKSQTSYISFLLDLLCGGLGEAADNHSFLLQMVNTIALRYDALRPASRHIQWLAKRTAEVLRSKIKYDSNLNSYPGVIVLPAVLYLDKQAALVAKNNGDEEQQLQLQQQQELRERQQSENDRRGSKSSSRGSSGSAGRASSGSGGNGSGKKRKSQPGARTRDVESEEKGGEGEEDEDEEVETSAKRAKAKAGDKKTGVGKGKGKDKTSLGKAKKAQLAPSPPSRRLPSRGAKTGRSMQDADRSDDEQGDDMEKVEEEEPPVSVSGRGAAVSRGGRVAKDSAPFKLALEEEAVVPSPAPKSKAKAGTAVKRAQKQATPTSSRNVRESTSVEPQQQPVPKGRASGGSSRAGGAAPSVERHRQQVEDDEEEDMFAMDLDTNIGLDVELSGSASGTPARRRSERTLGGGGSAKSNHSGSSGSTPRSASRPSRTSRVQRWAVGGDTSVSLSQRSRTSVGSVGGELSVTDRDDEMNVFELEDEEEEESATRSTKVNKRSGGRSNSRSKVSAERTGGEELAGGSAAAIMKRKKADDKENASRPRAAAARKNTPSPKQHRRPSGKPQEVKRSGGSKGSSTTGSTDPSSESKRGRSSSSTSTSRRSSSRGGVVGGEASSTTGSTVMVSGVGGRKRAAASAADDSSGSSVKKGRGEPRSRGGASKEVPANRMVKPVPAEPTNDDDDDAMESFRSSRRRRRPRG